MGQVGSFLLRKANRFNVENRAHRVLERDKPTMAPRYPHSLNDMKRTLEVEPKFFDKLNLKDPSLNERLKNVYVTSEDSTTYRVNPETSNVDISKSLPTSRTTSQDYEFGFQEPEQVTLGRCTLRQAIKFIYDHQIDSNQWTADRIASEYKLNLAQVEKILFYYKGYNLYIPDKNAKESIFIQAKPEILTSERKKSLNSSTHQ